MPRRRKSSSIALLHPLVHDDVAARSSISATRTCPSSSLVITSSTSRRASTCSGVISADLSNQLVDARLEIAHAIHRTGEVQAPRSRDATSSSRSSLWTTAMRTKFATVVAVELAGADDESGALGELASPISHPSMPVLRAPEIERTLGHRRVDAEVARAPRTSVARRDAIALALDDRRARRRRRRRRRPPAPAPGTMKPACWRTTCR